MTLDLLTIAKDVIAQAGPAARVRNEKSAHQANGCGFPAAIRAEETENFTLPYPYRNIVYSMIIAEALVESADVDGIAFTHLSLTSMGWPGWSPDALSC